MAREWRRKRANKRCRRLSKRSLLCKRRGAEGCGLDAEPTPDISLKRHGRRVFGRLTPPPLNRILGVPDRSLKDIGNSSPIRKQALAHLIKGRPVSSLNNATRPARRGLGVDPNRAQTIGESLSPEMQHRLIWIELGSPTPKTVHRQMDVWMSLVFMQDEHIWPLGLEHLFSKGRSGCQYVERRRPLGHGQHK